MNPEITVEAKKALELFMQNWSIEYGIAVDGKTLTATLAFVDAPRVKVTVNAAEIESNGHIDAPTSKDNTPVEKMPFSMKTLHRLLDANITTVGQLRALNAKGIFSTLKGSKRAVRNCQEKLSNYGMEVNWLSA